MLGVMAVEWLFADRCETAANFGWFVGVMSGGLADILIIGLIASAPKLGAGRPPAAVKWTGLRTWLQRFAGLALIAVWLVGGYHARAVAFCYATTLAVGCTLTLGIIILLAMMTAANQIGARSVR